MVRAQGPTKTLLRFPSLLLFNKRRCGELHYIPLDMFAKVQKNKPCEEFGKLLTATKKILRKKFRRIVLLGKGRRGVPGLLDKITQERLELAIQDKNNFIQNDNPYFFGVYNSDICLSGYHVFRKHVQLALGDEFKTTGLKASRLRKHLAQILKMGNDDLEQLTTFMDHTKKSVQNTAASSKNAIDKYKG